MKSPVLLLLGTLLLAGLVWSKDDLKAWRTEVLAKENKVREDNHLPPVVLNDTLNRLAQESADKMAKNKNLLKGGPSHDFDQKVLMITEIPGSKYAIDFLNDKHDKYVVSER